MDLKIEKVVIPEGTNFILGQAHFIKTIEDLHEAIASSGTSIKFGVAFCEASGPCLIRVEGNDEELKKIAAETALRIGAGHSFTVFLRNGFPINVLNRIKSVEEVCAIFCATANPVQVIIAENEGKRGVVGVIDGEKPKGIEGEEDKKKRKEFLRKIGYKT